MCCRKPLCDTELSRPEALGHGFGQGELPPRQGGKPERRIRHAHPLLPDLGGRRPPPLWTGAYEIRFLRSALAQPLGWLPISQGENPSAGRQRQPWAYSQVRLCLQAPTGDGAPPNPCGPTPSSCRIQQRQSQEQDSADVAVVCKSPGATLLQGAVPPAAPSFPLAAAGRFQWGLASMPGCGTVPTSPTSSWCRRAGRLVLSSKPAPAQRGAWHRTATKP